MSSEIPDMKTGYEDNITQNHKILLMSLVSVFLEDVVKTSLLYARHGGRSSVSKDDMIKAMRYEILHEQGSGTRLKLYMKEAMENNFIEDCHTKPEALRAVRDHMGDIQKQMPELKSTKEQSRYLVNRILGEEPEEDDDEEEEDEDENDEQDTPLDSCECEMCTFMNNVHILWSQWSPSDDLEKLIYNSVQKSIDSID